MAVPQETEPYLGYHIFYSETNVCRRIYDGNKVEITNGIDYRTLKINQKLTPGSTRPGISLARFCIKVVAPAGQPQRYL